MLFLWLLSRSSHAMMVVGDLRSKIAHWQFLDSWSGYLSWMDEPHRVVKVSSDASRYAWGGIIDKPDGPRLESRDIREEGIRGQPIAVKETLALVSTLQAGKSSLSNCRVDAHVDSLTFIQACMGKSGWQD